MTPRKPVREVRDELRTTEVQIVLGIRYQKARDLMLGGRLGECYRDAEGKWVVKRDAVERFQAERQREHAKHESAR